MTITRPTLRVLVSLLAATAIGAWAPAAQADDVVAADTALAAATGPTVATGVPIAAASRPRTIVVSQHDGRSVTLFAKGENIRRILAPGRRAAVFTGLTPGRVYTVAVGGEPIAAVVALDRPSAAHGLVVRRGAGDGTVDLTWRHTATAATGGGRVAYQVTAASSTAPTVTASVMGSRTVHLAGLDPAALYAFTVTPRNSAGAGRSTRAVMSSPLGRSSTVPAAPAVEHPATPAPAPAVVTPPPPAPAPAPSTRTVYRCPDGYTATDAGLCRTTRPYTFTTKPYTYSRGVVGSHSVPDDYAANVGPLAQGPVCPWGGYYVEPGICRGATSHSVTDYGDVKDAPPAGFTDDGTQWVMRNPLPEGFTDDGTQWVSLVPKEAVTVPA